MDPLRNNCSFLFVCVDALRLADSMKMETMMLLVKRFPIMTGAQLLKKM